MRNDFQGEPMRQIRIPIWEVVAGGLCGGVIGQIFPDPGILEYFVSGLLSFGIIRGAFK